MAGRISEYFKIRKQEKEEFIAFLEDVKHKISVAGQEYQELFRNPSAYVDVRKTAEWKSRFSPPARRGFLLFEERHDRKEKTAAAIRRAVLRNQYDVCQY